MKVAIVVIVGVMLLVGIAAGGNTLTVTQPPELKEKFSFNQVKGSIEERPSLFGIPAYGRSMRGRLHIPEDEIGCAALKNVDSKDPLVFILKRGTCTFATKVRYAQDAGATAVIVVNTEDEVPTHMSVDGSESSISIPSMIIKKSDGAILTDYMRQNKEAPVQISIEYGLEKKDAVEVDIWTSSMDPQSVGFNQLGEVFAPLQAEGKLKVNVHYAFVDGKTYKCDTDSKLCGNQCTNNGRYCAVDPDHDLSSGVSGAEVVQENLRRICLLQYASQQKDYQLPWGYAHDFWTACASANPKNVKEGCSRTVMEKLNSGLYDSVQQCVIQSGGADFDTDTENKLIEAEMKLKSDQNIYLVPSFAFNNAPYFGTTSCRSPISFDTCPLGQTMCNGFNDNAMPSVCRTSPGCKLGQSRDACGQCLDPASPLFVADKNRCFVRTGGVSVATVIGLIVVFIAILVGAAFVYHQHSAVKMRDELRNIMSQYVPLEGDGPSATEQSHLI